jgi:hypothetical protein
MKTISSSCVVIVLMGAAIAASLAVGRAEDPKAKSAAGASDEAKKEAPAEKEPKTLSDYMRLKLGASSAILEGLATEDMELVERGAQVLHEMSGAERFRVHNDTMYRQFSGDFRQTTSELIEAAKEKNLDRSALKWMDATMGCIECHRYVRSHLMVENARRVK